MRPALLAAFGLGLLLMTTRATPRGIRNHNPLNIRWDGVTQWQGLAGVDDDGFAIFASPEYGFRAAARILDTYRRRGITTVDAIIHRWAPPTENDTAAYVDHVANDLGLFAWEEIGPDDYPALLAVMTKHENGQQPYSLDTINAGVQLA